MPARALLPLITMGTKNIVFPGRNTPHARKGITTPRSAFRSSRGRRRCRNTPHARKGITTMRDDQDGLLPHQDRGRRNTPHARKGITTVIKILPSASKSGSILFVEIPLMPARALLLAVCVETPGAEFRRNTPHARKGITTRRFDCHEVCQPSEPRRNTPHARKGITTECDHDFSQSLIRPL
jgi:hypothetical protein